MNVIRAIRGFFEMQGFWEVETPALQVQPGGEVHVHAFRTEITSPDLQTRQTCYLHTSPELAMKKLLVAGCERIYQICPVYRNAEGSSIHTHEFKMLEWYRTDADYEDIMQDTIALFRHVAEAANIKSLKHKGSESNPFAQWQKISVCEAFLKYAEIDLSAFLPPCVNTLAKVASEKGYRVSEDDSWDDLFFRIFMEKIEPQLGQGVPTILYDYPAHMAALSKVKTSNPKLAERFEVYVCGLELANAFTELTDAKIQKERFEADMAQKEVIYGSAWPVDDDFIAALEYGMPEAGGIALGVDRLAMLMSGADDIKDVLFCE